MRWDKRGRIFTVAGQYPWMAHHAQLPIPLLVDDDRLRVYFCTRDEQNRSRTAFFDTDPRDPSRVSHLHPDPALDIGALGAFDDSGAMPACLVENEGDLLLYYVGWSQRVSVPSATAIGLAVSSDGGVHFERFSRAPVIDRTDAEPFGVVSPFVLREGTTWRMWYGSITGWTTESGRTDSIYVIKYAESSDGLDWHRDNVTCIEPRDAGEANGRPWVIRDGSTYRMWFSRRGVHGFREDLERSYRIGYAESSDGIHWQRYDDDVGISPSAEGWDSEMIAYAGMYEHDGTQHMLYNGNGFGTSGIGHAVLLA